MRIKINSKDNLWCIGCKEKINVGEKYLFVQEELYNKSLVDKYYHIECYRDEEAEDPYICED